MFRERNVPLEQPGRHAGSVVSHVAGVGREIDGPRHGLYNGGAEQAGSCQAGLPVPWALPCRRPALTPIARVRPVCPLKSKS